MATNLPTRVLEDSAAGTKLFFDTYGIAPLEFNANDVAATVGFFESRGFDADAALTVSATILKQAKIDGIPVYQILDTLGTLKDINLNTLIGEILNNNRTPTSTLGFRTTNVKPIQIRNIAA